MATFTSAISVPNIEGFGLNLFEFDAITLLDYDFDAFTTTSYRLYDDNDNEVIYGGNFVQDPVSGAVTGTVTSFLLRDAGVVLLNATGLSVDAASLFGAVQANDTYLFLSLISGEADTITGTAFNDNLWFGQNVGNDIMNGGNGDDYLYGGLDADTLNGGADADFLVGGTGQDIIDGGTTFTNSEDFDTVGYLDEYLYNMGLSGIVANLTDVTQGTLLAHQVIDTYGEVDTVTNVEEILGTGFDDTVYAPSSATGSFVFKGYAGNDTFIGSTTAADELDYRDDARFAETANAELGTTFVASGITVNFASDVVAGNGASGTITDSFGDTDTVSGVDRIRGTFSVDVFNGGVDDEFFRGLKGADIFNGGAGFDISSYSSDSRSNGIQPGGSLGIIADFSADVTANGIAIGTVVDGFGDTDQLNAVEVVEGTMFNDTFTGGADRVEFWSGEGADTFNGGSANDYADTGEDDDTIDGGAGDDELKGGDGTDTIYGGADNDNIRGDEGGNVNQGNDQLFGEAGEDSFKGGAGNDLIDGGADRDRVEYNLETTFTGDDATHGVIVNLSNTALVGVSVAGIASTTVAAGTAIDTRNYVDTLVSIEDVQGTGYDDIIIGNEDDNSLEGYEGNDVLRGGGGNDSLRGDDGGSAAGNDQLFGEAGDDYFKGGAGSDLIDGGADRDRVEYNLETTFTGDDATHGVIVNLSNTALVGVSVAGIASTTVAAGTAIDTRNYVDTLVSIEDVQGTGYDDVIIGNEDDNSLEGYEGNDVLRGGAGNDNLRGDDGGSAAGNDQLFGEAGDDYFKGGAGNDLIDGGADRDRVEYNLETTFTGDDATHGVIVNLSNTALVGVSVAGIASTTVAAGTAIDTRNYVDTLVSIEDVQGTGYDDIIIADGGENSITAYGGNDTVIGGLDNDYLVGGAGNDIIDGGMGGDDFDILGYRDEYIWQNGTQGVQVNLSATTQGGLLSNRAIDAFGTTDIVSNFELVEGTSFDDVVYAGALINEDFEFSGFKGNDQFFGTATGRDRLNYHRDEEFVRDVLEGRGIALVASGITVNFAADSVAGNGASGTVTDSFGDTDTVSGVDFVRGTYFVDTFNGGADDEEFQGLKGADIINGGAGFDVASYYNDREDNGVQVGVANGIVADFSTDLSANGVSVGTVVDGFGTTDQLSGIEAVNGTEFADTFTGGADRVEFWSGGGADTFNGGSANDYADGGDGDDTLSGGGGNDVLNGGADADTLGGGGGRDVGVFAGLASGATLNFAGVTTAVTTGVGGTDTLTNVEVLQFDDRMVVIEDPLTDFNADANSDLLWFRQSDGYAYLWTMDENAQTGSAALGQIGGDWTIQTTGDFNGDGSSDFMWKNTSTGQFYIWNFTNGVQSGGANLGNIGTSWNVRGSGDFNADGNGDIAWRNSDGHIYVYSMNNNVVQSGVSFGIIGSEWDIGAVGDFNGDGSSDIALRRSTDGLVYIWSVENNAIIDGDNLGAIGTNWNIAGTGDFNNDGTDDLLMRNATDGTLYFYFMQNSMVNAGASLGALGTDWLVDTVSDLDGDLQMDLALKNTSTGQFYIYNIENGAISGGANLGVVGTDWELV